MNLLLLILAIGLVFCFSLMMYALMRTYRAELLSSHLKQRNQNLFDANADNKADYHIISIADGYEIIRISCPDNEPIICTIKQFKDEDRGFAYREAQELWRTLTA